MGNLPLIIKIITQLKSEAQEGNEPRLPGPRPTKSRKK